MAVIHGTPLDDSLSGTAGADTISLFGGQDVAAGLRGADTILGGQGNDSLFGSIDPADASPNGNDRYVGGGGDDSIVDLAGHDTLQGGDGVDTLITALFFEGVGTGRDHIYGAAGDDVIEGFGALYGGEGNDVIQGWGGLYGGNGDDVIVNMGGDSTMRGGAGDDILAPALGSDVVYGGSGVDLVSYLSPIGEPTSYVIDLGAGTASSAEGVDQLFGIENAEGNFGSDTLTGDAGANTLYGAYGDDLLLYDPGDDGLEGGEGGFDTADYSAAPSAIEIYAVGEDDGRFIDRVELVNAAGERETDRLVSIERVIGTAFDDNLGAYAYDLQPVSVRHELYGAGGDDFVFGGWLSDALFGGEGNDRLSFYDGGDDIGNGGAGADLFVVDYPFPAFDQTQRILSVTIEDFTRGEDLLSIRGVDADFQDLGAADIFALLDTDDSGSLDNGDAAVVVGPILVDGEKQDALSFGFVEVSSRVTVTLLGVQTLTLDDFVDYYI